MAIKIDRNTLTRIISEEVRRALDESNGVLDERYLKLAEMIRRRIDKGVKVNRYRERNFTIPSTVFAKYNIYDVPFKNLKVEVVGNDRSSSVMGTGQLLVREWAPVEEIAHELVHIVQGKGNWKANARGHWVLSDSGKETAQDMAYDFDPSEMQARITEASVWLDQEHSYIVMYFKNRRTDISSFNEFYRELLNLRTGGYDAKGIRNICRLGHMESDIDIIERDRLDDFLRDMREAIDKFQKSYNQRKGMTGGLGMRSRPTSQVFGLLLTRPWYMKNIIPDYKNLLGQPEFVGQWWDRKEIYQTPDTDKASMWFVVMKARMLNYFTETYEDYRKKIAKSLSGKMRELYDEIYGGNNEEKQQV